MPISLTRPGRAVRQPLRAAPMKMSLVRPAGHRPQRLPAEKAQPIKSITRRAVRNLLYRPQVPIRLSMTKPDNPKLLPLLAEWMRMYLMKPDQPWLRLKPPALTRRFTTRSVGQARPPLPAASVLSRRPIPKQAAHNLPSAWRALIRSSTPKPAQLKPRRSPAAYPRQVHWAAAPAPGFPMALFLELTTL